MDKAKLWCARVDCKNLKCDKHQYNLPPTAKTYVSTARFDIKCKERQLPKPVL